MVASAEARTPISGVKQTCSRPVRAPDPVKRNFTATASDQLWVADFTYCSTWSGVVYVAFVVDVFSRRRFGWKAARTMHATLVVDALNMAAWTRRGTDLAGLICRHDAGTQYTSTAFTDAVDELDARPSIGTVGDSFDNAMAEVGQRALQDRTAPKPRGARRCRRALARPPRRRNRHLRMGPVVQRRTDPRRTRRLLPSRSRIRLLPSA